jgi:hypothetical protein
MAYFNNGMAVFLCKLDLTRQKSRGVLPLPWLLKEEILNYSTYLFLVEWIMEGIEGKIMKKILDKFCVMGIIALTLNQMALYIF